MRVRVLTDVTDAGGTVYALVRLEAGPQTVATRPPVNLALVIDRSSSMRGPRITQALEASRQLVERLGPTDRLSVVTFDAAARTIFGPEATGDAARARALDALAGVRTGVGTNLAGGIRAGAEAIASGFVRGAMSRLILLTDGQPSVGVTSSERLGALVEKETARGATITAMGVGVGFDDELLSELARRGRGGFYYLASAADIPAAFGRELEGVFAIAARDIQLKLVPGDEVGAAEVLHRLDSRPLDDGLLVEVGEVAAGAPRQILFKLSRTPGAAGRRCATLAVSWHNVDGSAGEGHIVGVELPATPLSAHAREVLLERLRLEVARAVDAAWARRASSDARQALEVVHEVKQMVMSARDDDRADPEALGDLLAELAEAEGAVARSPAERERMRRAMRERSHITLLGQSTIRPLPEPDDE
jgi:Ca-activated chloride channel homolog